MLRKERNRRRNARARLASVKAPVVRRPKRLHRRRSQSMRHGVDVFVHKNRFAKRKSVGSMGHQGSSPTPSTSAARSERRRQRAHMRRMAAR